MEKKCEDRAEKVVTLEAKSSDGYPTKCTESTADPKVQQILEHYVKRRFKFRSLLKGINALRRANVLSFSQNNLNTETVTSHSPSSNKQSVGLRVKVRGSHYVFHAPGTRSTTIVREHKGADLKNRGPTDLAEKLVALIETCGVGSDSTINDKLEDFANSTGGVQLQKMHSSIRNK